jgi:hypothetical protein
LTIRLFRVSHLLFSAKSKQIVRHKLPFSRHFYSLSTKIYDSAQVSRNGALARSASVLLYLDLGKLNIVFLRNIFCHAHNVRRTYYPASSKA